MVDRAGPNNACAAVPVFVAERNGMAACSELSEETATKLAQEEEKPCEGGCLALA